MSGDSPSDPPSDPPSISDETPTDPRRITQRSEPTVTQRRAAFQDDGSPESIMLAEINKQLGVTLGETNKQLGIMNAAINTVRTELTEDIRGLQKQNEEGTTRTLVAYETLSRHVIHLRMMSDEMWRHVFRDRPPPPPPSKTETLSFALGPDSSGSLSAAASALSTGSAAARQTGKRRPWVTTPHMATETEAATSESPKVRAQLDSHEGTLAALHGQMLAFDGRQERFEDEVKEGKQIAQEAKDIASETLKLQKEQMGKKDPEATRKSFLARVGDAFIWSWREREGQKYVFQLVGALTGLLWAINYFYALITGHALSSVLAPHNSPPPPGPPGDEQPFNPAPAPALPPHHFVDPAAR